MSEEISSTNHTAATTEQTEDATQAGVTGAVDDEAIFCPVCDYNLTANLAGRCPECGGVFDRDLLLEAKRTAEAAVMPWERVDKLGAVERFKRTVLISCLRPRRFALALAAQPRETRSTRFFVICLACLVAYVVAVDISAMRFGTPKLEDTLRIAVSMILATPLATIAVGAAYGLLIPLPDRTKRVRPWLSVVEYAGSHWLLIWVTFPLVYAVCALTGVYAGIFPLMLAHIFWFACFLLWVFTLGAVVRTRLRAYGKAPATFLLTFVVGMLAWGAVALMVSFVVTLVAGLI